jgi:hypothetical protein
VFEDTAAISPRVGALEAGMSFNVTIAKATPIPKTKNALTKRGNFAGLSVAASDEAVALIKYQS